MNVKADEMPTWSLSSTQLPNSTLFVYFGSILQPVWAHLSCIFPVCFML